MVGRKAGVVEPYVSNASIDPDDPAFEQEAEPLQDAELDLAKSTVVSHHQICSS
jgi:hypothetical protein